MSESQSGQPTDPSHARPGSQGADEVPFEISQEPFTPEGPHDAPDANAVPAPAYEHLGELPATYGTQSVYLVAYDPRRLFVYWDIDWADAPGKKQVLNVCRADGEVETQLEISAADPGRYVEVKRPGGTYYVELGSRARDGAWQSAASSARVTMPPEGLSGDTEPQFATLPFHLSFQRLLELIDNAMGIGEDLTAAISRLQQTEQPQVATLLGSLGHLSGSQLHTLETLLGRHLEVEGGGSPGGNSEDQLLRDRREATSSAGAFGSENLSSGGAFGNETLSSGAFGSENLSSGAFGSERVAPEVALGAETLSSGGFGSEGLSSGALAGGGSEELASGLLGVESLSSELLSSGGFGSESLSSGGLGGGSDLHDNERRELFLKAMENNLDVLGSLFSAFGSPGASDGFSAGGW